MTTETAPSHQRFFMAPGTLAMYGVWLAAVAALLGYDRANAYLALGMGVVVALLVAAGRWTLPQGSDDPGDALRQDGTPLQLLLRGIAIAGLVAWTIAIGFALVTHVPVVSEMQQWMIGLHTGLPRNGLSIWVTGTCVIVPLCVLLLLGARPKQLGLRWASGGTLRLLAWIAIPAGIMIWRVAAGRLSIAGLIVILVENFMLNGLPEEFVFRGVVLSYCRRFLRTDWAFLVQAVLFSLMHYGITIGDEHGRPLLVAANVLAENIPFALLFGLMAVRSRSIAMGTIVHFSLDAMRAALR